MDKQRFKMETVWGICIVIMYGLFISANTCMYHDTKGNFWKRDFCLENINLTGSVSISTSTSLLNCATICSVGKTCAIFTFNKTAGRCIGFSSFATTNHMAMSSLVMRPEIYSRVSEDNGQRVCNMELKVYNYQTSFENASKTCRLSCGRLLVLDTIEKQNCFFDSQDIKDSNYWIGLTDVYEEGVWLWVNGIPFIKPNEINVHFNNYDKTMQDKSMRRNADCALLSFGRRLIYDVNCEKKLKFICEKT